MAPDSVAADFLLLPAVLRVAKYLQKNWGVQNTSELLRGSLKFKRAENIIKLSIIKKVSLVNVGGMY